MQIDIRVTKYHWGLLLDTIINNCYYKMRYQGYSISEAKRLFRDYVKSELNT